MEWILLDEHLFGETHDGGHDAASRCEESLAGSFALLQVGNLDDGKVYFSIEAAAQTLSHVP